MSGTISPPFAPQIDWDWTLIASIAFAILWTVLLIRDIIKRRGGRDE